MVMQPKVKRGPGRPPGSKNKSKIAVGIDPSDEGMVIQDSPAREFSPEGEYPETIDDLSEAIEPEREMIEVTITIPLRRPPEGVHISRHVDLWLDRTGKAVARRWLYEGLMVSDEMIEGRHSEREVTKITDVERWLYQQIRDALPADAFPSVPVEGDEESKSAP